jgi:hypothetical protein
VSTPPVDTQTIQQSGGGLSFGSNSTPPKVTTTTISQSGGGLSTRGKPGTAVAVSRGGKAVELKVKKPLSPVIDKRSVKQKLKDAQARRN